MTEREAKKQQHRIVEFTDLTTARAALNSVLAKMYEKSGKDGTVRSHGHPFTANTRESRRVTWIKIGFSPTLGREPAAEIELRPLDLPAHAIGVCIEELVHKRIAELNAEIEKL